MFFFFNDTATTEIYTLSLHDALPISRPAPRRPGARAEAQAGCRGQAGSGRQRSEEHTCELQSQSNLVCRLLLEKKKSTPALPTRERAKYSVRRKPTAAYTVQIRSTTI